MRTITDECKILGLSPGRLQLPVTGLRRVINGAGLEGEGRSPALDMSDIHMERLSRQ